MRMTEEEFAAMMLTRQQKMAKIEENLNKVIKPRSKRKPNEALNRRKKYNNTITYIDGLKFDSIAEANHFEANKLKIAAGEMLFQLPQVAIPMPPQLDYVKGEKPKVKREKYIVDFIEFYADGSVKFVDVKGVITRDFARKKKIIEASYGIEILTPRI